jgi:hypothetical protein
MLVGCEIGYKALVFCSSEEGVARWVIRVRTSVSLISWEEEGAKRAVWNSSVFIPEKEVGGSMGARCAWWIG